MEIIAEGISEDQLATSSGLTPSMVSGLVRIGSGLMLPETLEAIKAHGRPGAVLDATFTPPKQREPVVLPSPP